MWVLKSPTPQASLTRSSFFAPPDYELVRVYHPDCSAARALLPSTSHSRFQAISDAYATLLGKPSARVSSRTWNRDKPYEEELRRRRRAQWRASASSDEFGYEGYGAGATSWPNENKEKWDRGVLVFILVFVNTSHWPVSPSISDEIF